MARLIDADDLSRLVKKSLGTPGYGDYYSGYDAALNTVLDYIADAPTAPAYGQWVNVKDRLPEGNGEYIVTACDEGEPYDERIWGDTVVVCAEYYNEAWTWQENGTEYSLDGIVTHWMPLPEPPDKRYKCRYADYNGVCSKLSWNGEIIYCVEGPCTYDMPEEVQDE